jgi:hypothetical protein
VTLGAKLALVFLAFLTILTIVIVMAFRERKLGRRLEAGDIEAQRASDSRVLLVIFTAAFGGMLLTLVVAWLVFF